MCNPLLDLKYTTCNELEGTTRIIAPFVACGDLNTAPDSDKTYPLELDDGREYKPCMPVTAPISPPYERAKLLKQRNMLGKHQAVDISNSGSSSATRSAPQQTSEAANITQNDKNNSKFSDLIISN